MESLSKKVDSPDETISIPDKVTAFLKVSLVLLIFISIVSIWYDVVVCPWSYTGLDWLKTRIYFGEIFCGLFAPMLILGVIFIPRAKRFSRKEKWILLLIFSLGFIVAVAFFLEFTFKNFYLKFLLIL